MKRIVFGNGMSAPNLIANLDFFRHDPVLETRPKLVALIDQLKPTLLRNKVEDSLITSTEFYLKSLAVAGILQLRDSDWDDFKDFFVMFGRSLDMHEPAFAGDLRTLYGEHLRYAKPPKRRTPRPGSVF